MKKLICAMLFGINLFLLINYADSSVVSKTGAETNSTNLKTGSVSEIQKNAGPESYAENVHMYICIEALKLLKMQFPQYDFSIFNTFIGTMNDVGTRQWQMGRITTGAYREDEEDPVFDIRGPFGFYVSNSHFFDADDRTNGDHSLTHLDLGGDHVYPNAYTKITKYIDGQWFSWNGSGYGSRRFVEYSPGNGYNYRFSYHIRGLIDLYKTNRIWYESITNTAGQTDYIQQVVTISDLIKNRIVWEALGRGAHLVQDMTVPAHTHNDVHVVEWDGGDCYHNHIDGGAYNQYNATTAWNHGGFIDPYAANDPIRYLMYSANQLADHYPSGPDCQAIPPQHFGDNNLPGGTYQMINDYYQILGPSPIFIQDVDQVAQYCFNHSIRATAALFYWFAIETEIFPNELPTAPHINSFSKNLPDNFIYRGENLQLTCNADGTDLHYDWFFKVCDTANICEANIPGLQFTETGNIYSIYNSGFRDKWTCSKYDSLCRSGLFNSLAPEPLTLILGVRVYNSAGEDTKYFNFTNNYNFKPNERLRPPPPPPPPSGCPYLLIDTGGIFVYDNNILKSSQNTKNLDKDVEDKYILKSIPFINDAENTVQLAIKEVSNDLNFIDEVSLYSIDYPKDKVAGITEDNEIVLYSKSNVISPSYAVLDGKDYSKFLKFDDYSKTVSGSKNDILNVQFDLYDHLNPAGNTADSIAIIFDPLPTNISPNPWEQKDISGKVNAEDEDGIPKSDPLDFTMRRKYEPIILPFFNNKKVKTATVNWLADFELSYFATVNVEFTGFNEIKYELASADELINGDVKDLLMSADNNYVQLDSASHIILNFRKVSKKIPAGMERKYVFHIKGKSVKPNSGNKETDNKESYSENILFSKLLDNYPNPFNPTTNIRYNLSEDNFTTVKVYNIQGKQISVLVSENQKSGFHTATFNGADLPSGIYYYTVSSGNFIQTKKMILLK